MQNECRIFDGRVRSENWKRIAKVRLGSFGGYPRRRGGNVVLSETIDGLPGLSPQARGKLAATLFSINFSGPIPAGAGETGSRTRREG